MGLLTPNINDIPSRSNVELSCDFCGKHFFRMRKYVSEDIKANPRHPFYCGYDCMGRAKYSHINKICSNCSKPIKVANKDNRLNNFCSRSCSAIFHNAPRRKPKKEKIPRTPNPFLDVPCTNCSKIIQRKLKTVEKQKYFYCNKKCQATYANKTYNRAGRFGKNRSKAEDDLALIISTEFPDLKIVKNDRSTISGGLELDLWIPSLKIAIELNGPCHYIPLFGEEELEKTLFKDSFKKSECQKLSIHFFIINIMSAGKRLPSILSEAFETQIKPLILHLKKTAT